MELRALAQALRLEGDAARTATRDALRFRAARRSLSPGAEKSESALELQEGLAEYTGTVVALRRTGESIARVARAVEAFEDQTAYSRYSRSFAYATRPALGLLLDRYAGVWRKKLKRDSDLSLLLSSVLGFRPGSSPVDRAKLRAERYGFRAVEADELGRETGRQLLLAGFRVRFIDGPVLQFPPTEELRRTFNPNKFGQVHGREISK